MTHSLAQSSDRRTDYKYDRSALLVAGFSEGTITSQVGLEGLLTVVHDRIATPTYIIPGRSEFVRKAAAQAKTCLFIGSTTSSKSDNSAQISEYLKQFSSTWICKTFSWCLPKNMTAIYYAYNTQGVSLREWWPHTNHIHLFPGNCEHIPNATS